MSTHPKQIPVTTDYVLLATVKAADTRPTVFNSGSADIQIWETKSEVAPTDDTTFSNVIGPGEDYTSTIYFAGFVWAKGVGATTAQVTHYPA